MSINDFNKTFCRLRMIVLIAVTTGMRMSMRNVLLAVLVLCSGMLMSTTTAQTPADLAHEKVDKLFAR
jgi:hypothetical protein